LRPRLYSFARFAGFSANYLDHLDVPVVSFRRNGWPNVTPSSIEAEWQSQKERRRRIIKFMLLIVLILLLLLIVLWFWITQPLFSNPTANSERTVEPARLEAHVRKLSVELTPRDESHIENLDRVAAYIKNEFSQTTASVSEQPYRVQGKSYRNVIAEFGPDSKSGSLLAHTTIRPDHYRAPTITRVA
jgi:hypothetical protein